MPFNKFENDPNDSQFALERQRAANVLRRKFKPAQVVRCQIVAFPDTYTVLILTPQQTYRYVRKPENTSFNIGTYVSVLDPGGENSAKIWEIINLPNTYAGNAGVTSLNLRVGDLSIVAGPRITVSNPTPTTIQITADEVNQYPTYNIGKAAGFGTYVARTSSYSVAANAYSVIPFQIAHQDDDGWWNPSFPTRLTVKETGWFVDGFEAHWPTESAKRRILSVLKNGQTYIQNDAKAIDDVRNINETDILSGPIYLNSGDYLELLAWSDTLANGFFAWGNLALLGSYVVYNITNNYYTYYSYP